MGELKRNNNMKILTSILLLTIVCTVSLNKTGNTMAYNPIPNNPVVGTLTGGGFTGSSIVGQAQPLNYNPSTLQTMSELPPRMSGADQQALYDSFDPGLNSGPTAAEQAAAAQKAENQKQIDAINRMLGYVGTQKTSGLDRLNSGFNEKNTRLNEDRARTTQGYADQKVLNDKSRMRGYEQVDNFANTSNNNLQRIFQGANAGNSSVARLLAPHLVGKAAGTRRTGVTETANENQANIFKARDDANLEYDRSAQDLSNQKKQQEEDFLRGINQNESDLYSKKQAFEQAGGIANADTQAQIDQRYANLQSLFGQFAPSYNVRAVAPKAVDLNSYSVDPAQIRLDQNSPAETRYYAPQLKKKQELA